jgi:hypothetical protein
MAAFDLEHVNKPDFARRHAVPPADGQLTRQ